MFVVQPIRYRHKLLVPTTLARLISADQEDRSSPRVENKQHAVGLSPMLNTQFLHVGVLRGCYRVHVEPAECRSEASKQVYLRPNVYLFGFG